MGVAATRKCAANAVPFHAGFTMASSEGLAVWSCLPVSFESVFHSRVWIPSLCTLQLRVGAQLAAFRG